MGTTIRTTIYSPRSLEIARVYPIVYIDALIVKVRDGRHVLNKAAHIVVGVDTDGIKHVLGIWVQSAEGAKLWLHVLSEQPSRSGLCRTGSAEHRTCLA
jgi:putative transposase